MPLTIPLSPEAFTSDWLTAALRESGVLRESRVTSAVPSSLGEGFGLLGSLTRLTLTYDRPEPGAPVTLVAKFPHISEANRDIARQYRIYEREFVFYREVAPAVDTELPRVLYQGLDASIGDAVILLADLAPSRVGDQLVAPTRSEVIATVREIAKVHAAWWGRCDSPSLSRVPYLNDALWLQVAQSMKIFWPTFQRTFPDLLNDNLREIGDRFAPGIAALADRLSAAPATLVHGDLRLDNLFFPTRPEHPALVIADWQLTSRGQGIYDIAYFMSQSIEAEMRRVLERDVVRIYHEALSANGVTGYSLESAWEGYRRAVMWCMMYPVAAGGGIDLTNDRGVELARAMARRSFAAIEELEADQFLD
ncbi:MAG: phosphotransferase [Dehalococcoidia bacterium]